MIFPQAVASAVMFFFTQDIFCGFSLFILLSLARDNDFPQKIISCINFESQILDRDGVLVMSNGGLMKYINI